MNKLQLGQADSQANREYKESTTGDSVQAGGSITSGSHAGVSVPCEEVGSTPASGARNRAPERSGRNQDYPYLRGDGVPVAQPLFQGDGGGSIPTSPLQLRFGSTDMDTAMMLNAYWHSRLPETDRNNLIRNRHRCYYVASFDGGLYAVAIWTDPVARKIADGATLELRRFAIAPEAPKNTATRMLAWMVRDIRSRFPEIGRLISYQDAEAHKGTIYRAQGWRAASYSTVPSWNVATRFRRASQSTAPKVRWELAIRTAHGSISTSRSESAEPSNQAPETVTATKEGPENSGFVTPSKSENGSIAAPKGEE